MSESDLDKTTLRRIEQFKDRWTDFAGDGKLLRIVRARRPYEGMNIHGVTGVEAEQLESLRQLGAVDEPDAS